MSLNVKVPHWVTNVFGIESKGAVDKTGKNRISGDTIIIDRLTKEFTDQTKKNIQNYKDAVSMCQHPETPKWYMLQDIYDQMETDAHYKSQVDILKGTILSNRFYIRDKSKAENNDKTQLLEKKWFYNLLSNMIDSVIKGYTACQLVDSEKMTFINIPRRNIVPQKEFVLFKVGEETGVSLKDPAFANTIIFVRNEDPYGLMNDLVIQLIFKRHAESAWAQFTERFGQPIPVAKTNKSDKREIDKIEAGLKKMGQAMSLVLPEGTTFELIAASGQSDPYNVFDKRIQRVNSEVSKRVLGGTMISDQGSSRSQSEVHERTMNDIIAERFRRMIEFEVTEQLIPILNFWGKGFDLEDEFVFDRTQQLALPEQWKIVKEVMEKYEVDEQWVSETFNIPITGIKKTASPVNDSINFKKADSSLALALSAKGILFPHYNAASCCKQHDVYMAGNPGEKILEELSNIILQYIYEGKDTLVLQIQKALVTGNLFREALFDSWGERMLNITYDAIDHHALASMEYNLFHFSCMREKSSVFALNELLLDKEKNGIKSFNDFKKAADPHLEKMNKNWLRTEYNFTVATGQNASRYHQFLEEAQTVTDVLQYQTVGDERVRNAHAMLDGRLFSIKDPEARRLWPPNDFGCRCEFLQFIGDAKGKVTSGKEGISIINWDDKQEKMFGVNRGDIGQVFLQNQFYIQDKGFAADVKAMKYSDYGLKEASELTGYDKLKLDKSITAKNVKELFVKEEDADYMGFKDYLNRSVILKEKTFDTKTTDETYLKEKRHQLFPHVKDVLNSPDEVYFFDYKQGRFQTNYIKHYDGKSVVVNTALGKNNLEVTTWYEMAKGAEEDVRRGLLIKGNKKP